jgi:hypothetical protein
MATKKSSKKSAGTKKSAKKSGGATKNTAKKKPARPGGPRPGQGNIPGPPPPGDPPIILGGGGSIRIFTDKELKVLTGPVDRPKPFTALTHPFAYVYDDPGKHPVNVNHLSDGVEVPGHKHSLDKDKDAIVIDDK